MAAQDKYQMDDPGVAEEGNIEGDAVNYKNDENKARGNWGGQIEFLLSCLGYAVGLGNVWRFPYLCYKNGGAVFLIPYAIMLFLVGVPIFVLELSLGQFSSSGPLTCWKFSRLFSGLGWGMVVVSTLVGIYYNMIIGWSIYYLIASFFELPNDSLPWKECKKSDVKTLYASPYCTDFMTKFTADSCVEPTYNKSNNGVCIYANGSANPLSGAPALGIWNATLAEENNIKEMVPSESYLMYKVWGRARVNDLTYLGDLKWELCLCLLGAWVLVYLSLLKGIKSSGKVVYFTAIFPYVMLVVLLIRGVLLEGHYKGIEFYMSADLTKLTEASVWKDAAVQIFFSLSASWGGLIALSSYNKFHNDCIRDSLIVAFGNCLTSFFAGFVIFSYLGYLATEAGQEVDTVVASGTGLAFVVYTRAVATIPASPLWSVLFFLMLITLGLDSEFALVETLLTSIMDVFPHLRPKKWLVLLVISVVMYLLGLTMCTEGGSYLLDLIDTYAGGWNVLLIALLECVAIAYVYGISRFFRDIEVMIGNTSCYSAWYCYKYWWGICWCFLTPVAVTFVMVFDWMTYSKMKYDNGNEYHDWAEALGWMCTLVVVVAIIIPPIYYFIIESGGCMARVSAIANPTVDWGPALVKHRRLVDYVDNWVIDPSNYEQGEFDSKVNYPNSAYQPDSM